MKDTGEKTSRIISILQTGYKNTDGQPLPSQEAKAETSIKQKTLS